MAEATNDPPENTIVFEDIPISALRPKTRHFLSIYLNPPKVLSSDDGRPRDWRGIFHLCDLDNYYWDLVSNKQDQMDFLLKIWSEKKLPEASFSKLQSMFGLIDRWDVYDDTKDMFGK